MPDAIKQLAKQLFEKKKEKKLEKKRLKMIEKFKENDTNELFELFKNEYIN